MDRRRISTFLSTRLFDPLVKARSRVVVRHDVGGPGAPPAADQRGG
jgi:hypothetical protein